MDTPPPPKPAAPAPAFDKARWLQLSPLLDELLDLAAPQRAARLAAMSAQDPALADELQALLVREQALQDSPFLAKPALQHIPTLQPLDLELARPGQTLGAYQLEHEIGRGGMGSVWLARRTDGRFEGRVAIKLLASGLFGRGDAGRFAREGQILAKLAHPHIARLLDAGVTPETSQPYLVLEYVDGDPIDAFCERRQLDTAARVTLFLDVLAAVAHAHNRLILHRDLKPSNILVNQAGEVKLLDFGIAKLLGEPDESAGATELTRQAGRAFTPQYAAPEQVQGGDVSTATDVYALGVLLYLLLSGTHPTAIAKAPTTPLDQMRSIVEVEPKKLSDQLAGQGRGARQRRRALRGDLDTIIAKALKKLPADRYANAADLGEDLRRWLHHEPIAARPDSRAYRLRKFLRRHRLGVAAGSGAALALGIGLGAALIEGHEAQRQRDQAEGLIEFMLGDLRKKLEPVGRLDVLDAVGDKALGYYSQQQLSSQDAESLSRRARALHLMGEIAEKRGKMAEAEQRFAQAAQSTAELLARDPKNPQRIFDQGQSAYWTGYAAMRQGKAAEARDHFNDYLTLSRKLVKIDPAKPEWQTELAWAEHNLGVLMLRNQEPQQALTRFEAAKGIWEKLLHKQPGLNDELAKTIGWIAEAQETLGQFDASIASLEEKLQLLPKDNKADRKAQNLQATTLLALSRLYLSVGRGDTALRTSQEAINLWETLSTLDAENLDVLARISFARMQLIETALALREPNLARNQLPVVNKALEQLLTADSSKPAWALKLKGRWLAAQLQQPLLPDQYARLRIEATDFLNQQQDSGEKTLDSDSRWVLALVALRLGDAWSNVDARTAQAQWQAVLRHLAPISTDVSEPRVISLRAHALLRLGRTQEARAIAEKLAASTYRHPEWQADLAKRLSE